MAKLAVFNNITLDGYFSGAEGDFSWAHTAAHDPEWDEFVAQNAGSGGLLLFGRVTYEIMTNYWPTPMAVEQNPVIAERMNNHLKGVFSRTLQQASWNNTTLYNGDLISEVKKLKEESAVDITILGSGQIVSQLTQAGLIDEYTFVVNPVVIGSGSTLFEGVSTPLGLKLIHSRAFSNGNVLLRYSSTDIK